MPLALLVIAILFSGAIGYVGYYFETTRSEAYQQSVSMLRASRNLYHDKINDQDLLAQYQTRFNDYQADGLIGAERRLSWIEGLRLTNQVLKLPTLTYNLLPQESFQRPGLTVRGKIAVKSSPMELTMGLLHEADLFEVLAGLRQSINKLFTVDSCQLVRMRKITTALATQKANLQTNCVIRWITINDP